MAEITALQTACVYTGHDRHNAKQQKTHYNFTLCPHWMQRSGTIENKQVVVALQRIR